MRNGTGEADNGEMLRPVWSLWSKEKSLGGAFVHGLGLKELF